MPNNPSKSKTIILAIIYASLFFLLFYLGLVQRIPIAPVAAEEKTIEEKTGYLPYLPVGAKAVYVFDVTRNKALYAQNEHLPLPLASLTKVMTVVCSMETLGEGATIIIEKSDLNAEGQSSLRSSESWRARDLASFMLVGSSNDAAAALARASGGTPAITSCMNARADMLGLFDTKFANESGLDIESSPGAYGSAENVARLFAFALGKYPDIFEKTGYQRYNVSSDDGFLHTATNTDKVINEIVGLSASKTGYTNLAGGNLVFAMNVGLGHKVIVVLLGSTEEGRFADAILISNAVMSTFATSKTKL